MGDFTENLGNGIKKALGGDAISSAASNAISNAINKTKNLLSGGSTESEADKQTKANNARAVQTATESFTKPKATPKSPTAGPKKKGMPSYKEGTPRVPETGPAMLHKDEAVLPKHEADKYRAGKDMNLKEAVKSELSGEHKKAPKVIKHIVTKKDAGGKGHIHVHVHTHPEDHPDEEHISQGNDGLMDHMMQHMGEANPGEAEADAGQSGIPGEGPQAAPGM